jgi:hypothetical protein
MVGDPAMDWYVERFPEGGVMVAAKSLGSVFVAVSEIEEDLQLVSRL